MYVNSKRPRMDITAWKWKRHRMADVSINALHHFRIDQGFNNNDEALHELIQKTLIKNEVLVTNEGVLKNNDIEIRPHTPIKIS